MINIKIKIIISYVNFKIKVKYNLEGIKILRTNLDFEGKIIKADKVYTKKEFNTFLSKININPPFIVKPNWISEDYGHYTDAKVLKIHNPHILGSSQIYS